jgi:hypothetical protein
MVHHTNQFPDDSRAIRSISGNLKEPGAESVTVMKGSFQTTKLDRYLHNTLYRSVLRCVHGHWVDIWKFEGARGRIGDCDEGGCSRQSTMMDTHIMHRIKQFPGESRAIALISRKPKEVRAESMTESKEIIPDGTAQRIFTWCIIQINFQMIRGPLGRYLEI